MLLAIVTTLLCWRALPLNTASVSTLSCQFASAAASPVQLVVKLNCQFMVYILLCKAHIKQCRKDGIDVMG